MAEKKKLSTTGKKVANLINQTVTGIYDDAVNRKYEQWFPNQDNSRPVKTTILHSTMAKEAETIAKQMDSALTQDDKEIINELVSNLPQEIANNYSKLIDDNGQRFGFTGNMEYDTDPYSQQTGTQRIGNRTYPVYASFMDGKRMGKNVSGYAGTNNTYSMCDIVCTIDIRSNTGEHVVAVLGKLQTLSYSIYQQKQPVRCLGNMNAKDYVYGQRTIAGSLVFAVFNKHWLVDIYEQLINKGMMKNWHYIADEIPPFDITISFANEYGYDSKMALYGVRLMTEGQVMSINDIYIENTYQFVATDIEYMDALNAWEQTNKSEQRWKQTPAAGTIASNVPVQDPTPKLKGKDTSGTSGDQDNKDKLNVQQSLIVDLDSLISSSEEEALKKLKEIYDSQRQALEEALKLAILKGDKEYIETHTKEIKTLEKQYETLRQSIKAHYAEQRQKNKK